MNSHLQRYHSSTQAADLAARLAQTLRLIGPGLQFLRAAPKATVPMTSVSRLSDTLARLQPALATARRRGDGADIWQIAGLGHDEVRNARVLSWLLDPQGSHGAGSRYLDALWNRIDGPAKLGFHLSDVERVTRENYPIGNGESRIDIEITGKDFLLFIEVKIYAGESKQGQVQIYQALARQKAASLGKRHAAVLYLSETELQGADDVLRCRWRDVAHVIRNELRALDEEERISFSSRLALHFANHIGKFH